MKKLAILLAVLCLLSLAACTKAEDPNNLFELPEGATPTEAPPQEKDTAPLEEDGYAYGNMQKDRSFVSHQGNIIFLHLKPGDPDVSSNGQMRMYSMDKETSVVSPFCTDAACTHVTYITTKCPAAYCSGNLEQYQGKLYMTCVGATGKDWSRHYPTEYKNGKFRKIFDGDIRGFVHGNGNLYAKTEDSSLIVLPEGKHKPEILVDEYNSTPHAVFGHYLYGSGFGGVTRVDLEAENPQEELIVPNTWAGLTDGDHIFYVSEENLLYRCNMDGSSPELMLQEPVHAASMNFDDEYLYFRLWSDEIRTGEDKIVHNLYRLCKDGASEPEIIATLPFTGYYEIYVIPGYDNLMIGYDPDDPPFGFQYYLVPKSGGDATRLELPDA